MSINKYSGYTQKMEVTDLSEWPKDLQATLDKLPDYP